MEYIYEMHQHVGGPSKCGRADPEKMVYDLKENGYAGVVMTDHFYHDNTGMDRKLDWADFCRPYEEAYLKARAAGDRIGIDVIFGLEEGFAFGKEVLIYGLGPEFMYAHPEMRTAKRTELYTMVHEAGGLLIQAHPFRDRSFIPGWREVVDPSILDGYEVFNRGNYQEENDQARLVAADFENYKHSKCGTGFILTAGSDEHLDSAPVRCGITVSERIRDEKALRDVLVSGNYELYCPVCRKH